MKKLVIGILAHVDAGKTTLSESLLYSCGAIKKLGRVDHKDAFLDTAPIEKARGITVYSKQAVFNIGDISVTLLDTPGHVDFSTEMERALQVLDCAILVISATDGVQAHTETLRLLLSKHKIPTFIFVNKMDLCNQSRDEVLSALKKDYSDKCVNFNLSADDEKFRDQLSMCNEELMNTVLEGKPISAESISKAIASYELIPCYFGSALKLTGISELMSGIERYATVPSYSDEFGARVFKITRDDQGNRLTHMKITGGTLKNKAVLSGKHCEWQEKAEQIRIYSGTKFTAVQEADAGTVCAVTGLTKTVSGEGLGFESSASAPILEPVLTYRMNIPDGTNVYTAFLKLKQLEDEDPQLHLLWSERLKEIHIQLMGKIQLEILTNTIKERFGLEVSFDSGNIVYKETVLDKAEGVGHFEPLRHYAEVHLIIEPAEAGSGLIFESACQENSLASSWQNLILTHLGEKTHLGVLTGSPITDVKITLAAGKAHPKHTEGGDFRQATYRAVRHGLMNAQSQLLEPFYDFRIELPQENLGRAMTDIQQLYGTCQPPEINGDFAVIVGSAPVSEFADYANDLAAYTRGRGKIALTHGGYKPCHNAEEVIERIGYDPEADIANTPDSVFCSHGAGVVVNWRDVYGEMHIESVLKEKKPEEDNSPLFIPAARQVNRDYASITAESKELDAIFEKTYGPIKKRTVPDGPKIVTPIKDKPKKIKPQPLLPEFLLIDGYNIIYAWDELREIANDNFEFARKLLVDIIANYQAYKQIGVIIVFDAYKVAGGRGSVETNGKLSVIYTKEAETADSYIERATYEMSGKYRVRVATSDYQEQLIVLGNGATRVSANELKQEVGNVEKEIREIIANMK